MTMTTTEREVFAVPGWNFVAGDRQIEAILRDLPPHAPLVVRNRLANVLATVAGLADLSQLAPDRPLPLNVHVPENALVEPALDLDELVAPQAFHGLLLKRLYGVSVVGPAAAAPPGALVLAVGYGQSHATAATALATWLGAQTDVQLIIVAPAGEPLADALRPWAQGAWSLQHWGGWDAFMRPELEEAVLELDPDCLFITATDPNAWLYTAVGAADYRLRRLAEEGLPATPRLAGAQVLALAWPEPDTGPAEPVRDLVRQHLLGPLGVVSTGADQRFRVTAEAIAIDLVQPHEDMSMLKVGHTLDRRYEVEALLGQGGMGHVYRVRHAGLDRHFALKVCADADPQATAQFREEARILAELAHPLLPRVSDYFSSGGNNHLVMEYIPGSDLQALYDARDRPFEPAEVLPWLLQLLEALAYLHARGVVHRDIKPANLKLTPDGRLVLVDFGIAKAITGATPGRTGFHAHKAYTPYMAAPEQVMGGTSGPRTDLYAVGSTFSYLLTGQLPPTAQGLPAPLGPVLLRAMAADPGGRWADATAMRQALAGASPAAPRGVPFSRGREIRRG